MEVGFTKGPFCWRLGDSKVDSTFPLQASNSESV